MKELKNLPTFEQFVNENYLYEDIKPNDLKTLKAEYEPLIENIIEDLLSDITKLPYFDMSKTLEELYPEIKKYGSKLLNDKKPVFITTDYITYKNNKNYKSVRELLDSYLYTYKNKFILVPARLSYEYAINVVIPEKYEKNIEMEANKINNSIAKKYNLMVESPYSSKQIYGKGSLVLTDFNTHYFYDVDTRNNTFGDFVPGFVCKSIGFELMIYVDNQDVWPELGMSSNYWLENYGIPTNVRNKISKIVYKTLGQKIIVSDLKEDKKDVAEILNLVGELDSKNAIFHWMDNNEINEVYLMEIKNDSKSLAIIVKSVADMNDLTVWTIKSK